MFEVSSVSGIILLLLKKEVGFAIHLFCPGQTARHAVEQELCVGFTTVHCTNLGA